MSKKPDNVLTIDDLSTYLKVPKSSLYKLVQEGKLPGTKVGRHLAVPFGGGGRMAEAATDCEG